MRSLQVIAVDVLRCALSWDRRARLLGNVTAGGIVRLVIPHITRCPSCGAEAWVNIDCDTCLAVGEIEKEAGND